MSNYLEEAFKELDLLKEDAFDLRDDEDIKALGRQLDNDDDLSEIEMVVDIDTEDEEELQSTYVGKVLLWCPICHTLHYADKESIVKEDEEEIEDGKEEQEEEVLVNLEETCPECHEKGQGFVIKGQVAEYKGEDLEKKEKEDKPEDEEEINLDLDLLGLEDEEEKVKKESLSKKSSRKSLKEKLANINKSNVNFNDTSLLEQMVEGDISGREVEIKELGEDDTFDELEEDRKGLTRKLGRKFARKEESLEESKCEEKVSKRDDIDAKSDDKKELAKKRFMKKKDDADADKDYQLKKAGLQERFDVSKLSDKELENKLNSLDKSLLQMKQVQARGGKNSDALMGTARKLRMIKAEMQKRGLEVKPLDSENKAKIHANESLKEKKKRQLNEQVSDIAYDIEDTMVLNMQDKNLYEQDEFEEQFVLAVRELYGIDNIYELIDEEGKVEIEGQKFDIDSLLNDIRGILGYDGWETIYEGQHEGGIANFDVQKYLSDDFPINLGHKETTEESIIALINNGFIDDTMTVEELLDYLKDIPVDVLESLKEKLDDYYILGDGKNPKKSRVYDKIEVDEFVSELEKNKEGKPYHELVHYVKGQPTRVWTSEKGKIEESINLKEEPIYDLSPTFDSRQSFYGKARVEVRPDGSQILWSYSTPVAFISKDGKEAKLLTKGYYGWNSSQTTVRHVKDFLRQNGFEAGSSKDLSKKYEVVDYYELDKVKEESLKEGKELQESQKQPPYHLFLVNASKVEDIDLDKEEKEGEFDSVKEAKAYLKELTDEDIKDKKYAFITQYSDKEGYTDKYALYDIKTGKRLKEGVELQHELKDRKDEECKDEECKKKEALEESLIVLSDFSDYEPWSGAIDTYERIEREGLLEDLEWLLEDLYPEGISLVQINDILWFDSEWVFEQLGIKEDEEDEEEIELDDLDESLFDNLVNKYLNKVYENVDKYVTSNGTYKNGKLVLEGIITHKSGKNTNTKFVFEKVETKDGKIKMNGLNETLSNSKKAFTLNSKLEGSKLLAESLSYHYNVKTNEETKRLNGKVVNR